MRNVGSLRRRSRSLDKANLQGEREKRKTKKVGGEKKFRHMLETRGQKCVDHRDSDAFRCHYRNEFRRSFLLAVSFSFSDLKVFRTVGESRLTISKARRSRQDESQLHCETRSIAYKR